MPWFMLAGVALVLAAIALADRRVSRRRARTLRRLAEQHGFRYSRVDRFALAGRVRGRWASGDVAVRDLMYRSDPAGYVYAFTAVHDGGRTVLSAREPAGSRGLEDVRAGDATLPLDEQYRRLTEDRPGPEGRGVS